MFQRTCIQNNQYVIVLSRDSLLRAPAPVCPQFPTGDLELRKKHFSAPPHCPPRGKHPRPETSPMPPFLIWKNVLLGFFFLSSSNEWFGFFVCFLRIYCGVNSHITLVSGVQCHNLMSVHTGKWSPQKSTLQSHNIFFWRSILPATFKDAARYYWFWLLHCPLHP